jgi:hypothetical protein
MRLIMALSIALLVSAPVQAQYDNGYGRVAPRMPTRASGGMSAQQLCAYADKAEAQGNYVSAFNIYKQGCGVVVGARVAATPDELLYFRDRAGQVFPKALAQLVKTHNTGAVADLMREGNDLFARLVRLHPQMAIFHMRWGEVLSRGLGDYEKAQEQFKLAMQCPDLPPAGRTYVQQQLAFTTRRIAEVAQWKRNATNNIEEWIRKNPQEWIGHSTAPASSPPTMSRAEENARNAGDNMAADRIRDGRTLNSDTYYKGY